MNRFAAAAVSSLLPILISFVRAEDSAERRDWHTAEFDGRDEAMWGVLSKDLSTSFPSGGSPVVVPPYKQDDRIVYNLADLGISGATELHSSDKNSVLVKTADKCFRVDSIGGVEVECPLFINQITLGEKILMVEGSRLLRSVDGGFEPILEAGRNGLPDTDVRDIGLSRDGEVYVATASGIGILNIMGGWRRLTGREGGLPVEDVTSISFASDGTLWAGTAHGAARRSPSGDWSYRAGPRWMTGDRVVDVAATDDGGAWILTNDSLTHIIERNMTLRDKARLYDSITQERHVRHGAVSECTFLDPNDTDSWVITDNDNDGLWTSIYTAAKCFEYASTRNPEAKFLAKRHFDFLARLESITGSPGYIARSIRPANLDRGEHEIYYAGGGGKWFDSTVEPGWSWKSDTSSDELSGHFFAWGVYYDLVAKGNPEEEARVQGLVRRVMNNLIDHDFNLVDVDGAPTRWGVYDPKMLHGDLLWSDSTGFNALLILSHLKVAMHICGDEKFKEAYRTLIDKWGYNVKAMFAKEMIPNTPYGSVNHSDDEMAWLAYYHLLLYPDEDPKLDWQYRYSAVRSMRPLIPEKSPFFNFPFAVEFPNWAHVRDGVETLKNWPFDLRQWSVRNSLRDDVVLDKRLNREGSSVLLTPPDADERIPDKWNQDPFIADEGYDDGRIEADGGSWLLPYWMAVYHGLIVEETG
ncbi:hypothetical protein HYR69_11370 [Candidatus Sumerlaeota bacterium]|nr:hypothetical protein [Candidatus Sumerlaeota bacterium]MBI3736537.1 hypothetical protein [Candidatus Sumerlaeota bacterium]